MALSEANRSNQHLFSEYVLIDTEAYFRCGFDFSGKLLGKFVELAKAGLVRVLITDITRREVLRAMRLRIEEAIKAGHRDRRILQQVGAVVALPTLDEAVRKSESAFERFLEETRAILVPLNVDINSLVDDYFQ